MKYLGVVLVLSTVVCLPIDVFYTFNYDEAVAHYAYMRSALFCNLLFTIVMLLKGIEMVLGCLE